jgi:hypothetical protein
MKRHPGFLLALLGLVLTTSLSVAISFAIRSAEGPVYSVATVQAGLAHQPGVWLGRTVRVRGLAVPPGCVVRESMLCVKESSGFAYIVDPITGAVLPLSRGAANALLSVLRHLPLVGTLAPAAQTPHWGELTTYRAQLLVVPSASCTLAPCYQAALLDAAP